MTLEKLLKEYKKHFPQDSQGADTIARAFSFAKLVHRDQKRASGDNYFSHLFETAHRLATWRLDYQSIAAGLLHDTIEDCAIPPEAIRKEFGDDISFLVEGVTKLGALKYREEEQGMESLRKMILAISKDLRVIFIKLADRLHNMRTLGFVPPQKQKRIALETAEIYAPIAYRLGMQSIAGELEDLAFPYIHPEKHKWMVETLKETYEERTRYLKSIEPTVRANLGKAGIKPLSMDYRAKRLYSLYKKLLRYDMNLDNIYDLVALRIIVNSVEECYLTLGVIHQTWPPLPGRIKDYIALPKPNGYQSLHTTVFCVDNRPTEFQIRTQEMHEQAEHGSAAHWFYESKKGSQEYNRGKIASADSKETIWIRQLKEWQNQFPGSKEFIEALKVDFFSDRIFVLTPKGKVIDLPASSTPIDFAYHIHSTVGDSCVGAKVNNKIVSLETPLQSGDIVEILTQKNKKPSEGWLSFAKTHYARKKIKTALKKSNPLPKKTEYRIACRARIGLIKDVTAIISRNHFPVMKLETFLNEKYPFIKIIIGNDNKEKAERLMLKIKKVDGIKEIGYKLVE
jgi:GTP pyrophosphokinase